MTAEEEQAFLEHINASDMLDVLDPRGICSSIQFTSVTNAEGELTLEVTLDPNGDEIEDVCTMAVPDLPMLSSQGELRPELVQAFTMQFIEWIRDAHYDEDF